MAKKKKHRLEKMFDWEVHQVSGMMCGYMRSPEVYGSKEKGYYVVGYCSKYRKECEGPIEKRCNK